MIGDARRAIQFYSSPSSRRADRYADGVFFVDLSVVTEPGLVWGAIACALGVSGGGLGAELPPRELVLGRLTDATALVIFQLADSLLHGRAGFWRCFFRPPQPNVPIQPAMAPPISFGESS